MVSITCFNIYGNTFGSNNYGVVLFEYSLGGIKYKIMKRSIKRTIFMQILLLTLSGLDTMRRDKKMGYLCLILQMFTEKLALYQDMSQMKHLQRLQMKQ